MIDTHQSKQIMQENCELWGREGLVDKHELCFNIRAVVSLTLRNTKRKNTTKKAMRPYVWACPIKVREGIERRQYFKSKGNVATMLKQSLQEIKST